MKKVITSLLVFASLLLFTACGKKVTTEDLKANDAKYTVSKEDKNIILTPEKSNKSDDNEKLVLKPYKKEKTK